jgi:hypothetical protein
MEIKEIIRLISEFKHELDSFKEFSPQEKEIILGRYTESVMNKEAIPKKYLAEIPEEPKQNPSFAISNDTFAGLVTKAKISQHNDYVLFAVYHLVIQKNMESVTVKEIEEEYKKARIKPSSNTTVYVTNLTKAGSSLLMQVDKKEGVNAFTITRNGIVYVEEVLKNVTE